MTHPQVVLDYFARVGAEVLNFRRAMVKTFRGHYYIEKATIKITDDGDVICSAAEFAPTEEEAAAMKKALAGLDFPRSVHARTVDGLLGLVKGEVYEFRSRKDGLIIMAQERRINKNGTKQYIPWVLLSNGEWAAMEPDGDLPFFKPQERLGPGARIMIHEGAKAAAAAEKIARGEVAHPWARELAGYEHWGMIGGAQAPHRADYDELREEKPTEVVYVCDNDLPGIGALQKVSEKWGRSMKGVVFGDKFPQAWDIADPMPAALFTPAGRYIGPTFNEYVEAATWATKRTKVDKKTVTELVPAFAEEWIHSIQPEVFIHRDWPAKMMSEADFNSYVGPFSHAEDTARLMRKQFAGKAMNLKYSPEEPAGIYGGDQGGRYVNTFAGSPIESEVGDPTPWLNFIDKLVMEKNDKKELLKWCATLIARPDIKMLYGLLLISEQQGVGKGTLGEKILAPLVGLDNVSYPSEQEIVDSNFNSWLAHKRLAVVHEIYAGNSSKAYNKLKSVITDKMVTVNKKYQASYSIENWIHVLACSNSWRAIKLSLEDRRWFVPKLTELKASPEYWAGLNQWLRFEGGLGIIRHWAENYGDYVASGEGAPGSKAKSQMIEEGYSSGQQIAAGLFASLREKVQNGEEKEDVFVLDTDVVELIKNTLYEGRHNDRLERPATIRNVAKSAGWFVGEGRAKVKAWGANFGIGGRVLALNPEIAKKTPGELDKEGMAPLKVQVTM